MYIFSHDFYYIAIILPETFYSFDRIGLSRETSGTWILHTFNNNNNDMHIIIIIHVYTSPPPPPPCGFNATRTRSPRLKSRRTSSFAIRPSNTFPPLPLAHVSFRPHTYHFDNNMHVRCTQVCIYTYTCNTPSSLIIVQIVIYSYTKRTHYTSSLQQQKQQQ